MLIVNTSFDESFDPNLDYWDIESIQSSVDRNYVDNLLENLSQGKKLLSFTLLSTLTHTVHKSLQISLLTIRVKEDFNRTS